MARKRIREIILIRDELGGTPKIFVRLIPPTTPILLHFKERIFESFKLISQKVQAKR